MRCSHRRRRGRCPLRNLTRSVISALLRVSFLIFPILVVYKSRKRCWLLGSLCLLDRSPLSWFLGPSVARQVAVMWIPAWLLHPPAHCPKGYSVWNPDDEKPFRANDSGAGLLESDNGRVGLGWIACGLELLICNHRQ